MAFLARNILTASPREFRLKEGESVPGSEFRWVQELSERDCSARWEVSSTNREGRFVCELIDPADDEFLLALCTNALGAKGATNMHPGVMNIVDSGWMLDGVYFQIVDSTEDETYLPLYAPGERLEESSFLSSAQNLILGLAALHKSNVVHGAISPECIRVSGRLMKLSDFWWSRDRYAVPFEKTIDSYYPERLSTMSWLCLAPEIIKGELPTRESDLYSLASTWFYLLTGEFPRDFEYSEGMLIDKEQLLNATIKDLRQFRNDLKPQVYRAIDFALQADAVAREDLPLVRELIKEANDGFAFVEEGI